MFPTCSQHHGILYRDIIAHVSTNKRAPMKGEVSMPCDVTNMSRTGLCNLEFGEVEGDLVGAARWTATGWCLWRVAVAVVVMIETCPVAGI